MSDPITPRKVRGMRDILPAEQTRWNYLRSTAEETARLFGFSRIDVPTIEYTELFDRGIGQETDIVSKELFLVGQKDDAEKQSLALRPEMTAGIARAFIQNGMGSLPQPVRLYSIGSVFRYDRPQKGRYREHTQFDVESIGSSSAAVDAWVIYLGWSWLQRIGLNNVQVQINSLGSPKCQEEYAQKLRRYFTPHKNKLNPVDQRRLEKNPLRLIDSKDEAISKLKEDAPQSIDCLDKESKQFFSQVLSYLDEYKVVYNLNPAIVRGLDYYGHTVFELVVEGEEEAQQSALGGGGRYNKLMEIIGGKPTSAFGMGIGLDRVALELANQKVKIAQPTANCELFIIHLSKRGRAKAQEVLEQVHNNGFVTLHSADKSSLRAQLKMADKWQAKYAIIIGETEAKNDMCILRDMKSGIQEDIHCPDLQELLVDRLRNGRSKKVNR